VTATATATLVPAPIAVDDLYTPDDTDFTIPAPGVLGNDILNGAVITSYTQPVPIVTAGPPGSVVLNADGSFTYTAPNGVPTGLVVRFTYTITNAGGASTASVTFEVPG
jgi:hypothetical protein